MPESGGRAVTILAPVGDIFRSVNADQLTDIIADIRSNPSGIANIQVQGHDLKVLWTPIEVRERRSNDEAVIFVRSKAVEFADFSQGTKLKCVFNGRSLVMKFDEPILPSPSILEVTGTTTGVSAVISGSPSKFNTDDVLYKAIENRFDAKLKQFPGTFPILLVLRIDHYISLDVSVVRLLQSRIWPNPKFGRLSAIAIFHPREAFNLASGGRPSALVKLNPNAKHPIPSNIQKLMGLGVA